MLSNILKMNGRSRDAELGRGRDDAVRGRDEFAGGDGDVAAMAFHRLLLGDRMMSNRMKRYTHLSHAKRGFTVFAGLATTLFLTPLQPALATDNSCADVLVKNAGLAQSNSSDKENAAQSEYDHAKSRSQFYSSSDQEAFDMYQKASDEIKNRKGGGSGGGSYGFGFISGDVNVNWDYGTELKYNEFKQKFDIAKQQYQQSEQQEHDRQTVSSYESETHSSTVNSSDALAPGAVAAWTECVKGRENEEPGLHSVGARDSSGMPYFTIIWVPGPFAAEHPSVDVEIALPSDDIEIKPDLPSEPLKLANGSGKGYFVRYTNERPGPIMPEGFTVQVNGTITNDGGEPIGSLAAPIEFSPVKSHVFRLTYVPAKAEPIPLPPAVDSSQGRPPPPHKRPQISLHPAEVRTITLPQHNP